jgi:ankyrin repeat protein
MASHLCADLFTASKTNHPECIRSLIGNGAEGIRTDPNKKDDYGAIPLHYASWHGYNDCVNILINFGSDVNSRNNCGWTPLFKAVRRGHVDTIMILIDNGADTTLKTNCGWTLANIAKTDAIRSLVEGVPYIKDPGLD